MKISHIRNQIEKNTQRGKYSMLVHTNGRFTLIDKEPIDYITYRVKCSYTHGAESILQENMDCGKYLKEDMDDVVGILSSYDLVNWNFPSKDVVKIEDGYSSEFGVVFVTK